ncbi:MAG: adenosylcobinamide-GDP ribazoletransferase, partial [Rhizobiaceae bacterium]|nr:adenosylcobinamide-GDP ribazoletransferase [Rhizobiaceae bacterium]
DVFAALVAAHMASRALIPTFMASLTPARLDGLSASAGPADTGSALAAAALGAAALLFLGIGAAVAAVIGLAALFFAFRSICRTKIGGQTGDTIGAVQQLGEIAVLVVAAAALGHPPPL